MCVDKGEMEMVQLSECFRWSIRNMLHTHRHLLSEQVFYMEILWLHHLKVKVTQSCPVLWDCMAYTVHGILQARIPDWAAVLSSRGSSQPRDQTQVSCSVGRFFTSWATREAHITWSHFRWWKLHHFFLTFVHTYPRCLLLLIMQVSICMCVKLNANDDQFFTSPLKCDFTAPPINR